VSIRLSNQESESIKAYGKAKIGLKVATEFMAKTCQPRFKKYVDAKDQMRLVEFANRIPNSEVSRRMYMALSQMEDKPKPTKFFKNLFHTDQNRIIQTFSNEAMKSADAEQGCRAGLYIRNINTAMKMMNLIGDEWLMLYRLSNMAVKAMEASKGLESVMYARAFHDCLALKNISPIEIDDSYFQHENKLEGEVWLTRDREYWEKH